MKTLIAALFLMLGASAHAATTYTIIKSSFTHDSTEGTFVVSNSTYGFISAISYRIGADDEVNSCQDTGEADVSPSRGSFPTANQTRNTISAAVSDSGLKRRLDKCLAKKAALQQAILISGVATNVPGVDGATITPP